MNDQSYLSSGFNQFFQRDIVPVVVQGEDVNQFDFESQYIGLSGNQIQGGIITSPNGRFLIDVDGESLIVSDGAVERIRLGKLNDESYGLMTRDVNGNALIQLSGNTNIIKSGDGVVEINFDNSQILIREPSGLTRVILGKID